jgi:hypothetical protein
LKFDECFWVGKTNSKPIQITGNQTFYQVPPSCNFESNVSETLNFLVKYNNNQIPTVAVYDTRRIIVKEGEY